MKHSKESDLKHVFEAYFSGDRPILFPPGSVAFFATVLLTTFSVVALLAAWASAIDERSDIAAVVITGWVLTPLMTAFPALVVMGRDVGSLGCSLWAAFSAGAAALGSIANLLGVWSPNPWILGGALTLALVSWATSRSAAFRLFAEFHRQRRAFKANMLDRQRAVLGEAPKPTDTRRDR